VYNGTFSPVQFRVSTIISPYTNIFHKGIEVLALKKHGTCVTETFFIA
jgi:hypothetical protein